LTCHPGRTNYHPCQLPEDLVSRIALTTTDTEDDDVVLELYMGTGTVAVVARDNKSHFIGVGFDEQHFNFSKRQLKGEPRVVPTPVA